MVGLVETYMFLLLCSINFCLSLIKTLNLITFRIIFYLFINMVLTIFYFIVKDYESNSTLLVLENNTANIS